VNDRPGVHFRNSLKEFLIGLRTWLDSGIEHLEKQPTEEKKTEQARPEAEEKKKEI